MSHSVEKEFTDAYDAYADAVFRHCFFKTGDRELAKDLMQETFLKVWVYVQRGERVANLRAFLYTVAGNLVIDWYRRRKSESLDTLVEAGFDPPDQQVHETERAEMAWTFETMNRLRGEDRDLILWRYVEELSPKEIGVILDETENVVSVRLNRAMKRLRELVADKISPHT